MLTTRQQYSAPLNWAAFTLVGETGVTRGLRAATGQPVDQEVKTVYAALPVPEGVTHYTELPSAALPGNVDIVFQTQLSIAEVGQFYRKAFRRRGLKESRATIGVDRLSMVFLDSENRRRILVQSHQRSRTEPHQVFVRVEPMRPSRPNA